MRHFLNTIGLLAVILFTAGCRDTGYDVSESPGFNIVNADVSFLASGGSGTIGMELLKSGTPTIQVDKDWCHATLSGSTINITVDPNSESFSRQTALKITMGDYSRTLGISQGGIYYYAAEDFEELGYRKDDELRIPLTREGPMDLQVKSCSNWVDAYVSGDEIVVRALENNGMSERTGVIILKAGVDEKVVNFVQRKFNIDYHGYLGDWVFQHYTAVDNGGTLTSLNVKFAIKEEGVSYTVTGLLYPLTIYFTDERLTFNVGQVVGRHVASSDGLEYDVTVRLLNATGSVVSTTSFFVYSTFDVVDGNPVVTLHPSGSQSTTYTGFAFYYTTSSTNYSRVKYFSDIKLYKK